MKKHVITSHQNTVFKMFLDLLGTTGIVKHQQALISGKKSIKDMLNHDLAKGLCRGIIHTESQPVQEHPGLTAYCLPDKLFDELDIFGSHCPLLLVNIPEISKWDPSASLSGCSLFLPFQDPSNMGAILRTAAAMKVSRIILGPSAAHPFHPKSCRAASGTLFHNQYLKCDSDWKWDFGNNITVALDLTGAKLSSFQFLKDFILVVGSEGQGVSVKFSPTQRVTIPISDQCESLNAVVATSIALYQWSSTFEK